MECAACINTDAPAVFQYLPACDVYLHNVCFVHFTSWMEEQACLQRTFRAWRLVARKRLRLRDLFWAVWPSVSRWIFKQRTFSAVVWHRRYLQRVYVRRWALHTRDGMPALVDSSGSPSLWSRLDSNSSTDSSP